MAQATYAQAAYIHVHGNACPGGEILYFIWSGEGASGRASLDANDGYTAIADTYWEFHDSAYDGDEYVHLAVKCNNNAWYYPVIHVHGYVGDWAAGWV